MIHSSTSSYSSTFWLPGAGNNSTDRNHPSSSDHDLSGYDQVIESFPGRNDCLRLLRELNRQVSTYHHLATALGGSSDGQHLRCQLKRTRRRARELASLIRNSLPVGRMDGEVGKLWCLLYCCLYLLGMEMQRTLNLEQTFALHSLPTGFINTGLYEFQAQCRNSNGHHHHHHHHHYHHHHHSHTNAADYDIPLVDRLSLERAEISQLQKEIQELETALMELRSAVDIESYLMMATSAVEATTSECDDSSFLPSHTDNESEEIGSSADDSTGESVEHRRCLCIVMAIIIFIFLAATILGVALAFQFS